MNPKGEFPGELCSFLMPKSKANPTNQILQFLLEKNRPYSATNLVDELHGEFTKTVIQKSLDQLTESGQITCKLCGKSTKLYFAKQEGKEVASKEQLVEMDQNNNLLQQKIEELKKKRDELKSRRDTLSSTRTLEDLRSYRVQIEIDCQTAAKQRDELIQAAQGINPDDIAQINKEFNTRCDQWKKRKALCMDILNQLCDQDGMDKKPKDLIEDIGIETDEQYHLKLEFKDRKFIVTEV